MIPVGIICGSWGIHVKQTWHFLRHITVSQLARQAMIVYTILDTRLHCTLRHPSLSACKILNSRTSARRNIQTMYEKHTHVCMYTGTWQEAVSTKQEAVSTVSGAKLICTHKNAFTWTGLPDLVLPLVALVLLKWLPNISPAFGLGGARCPSLVRSCDLSWTASRRNRNGCNPQPPELKAKIKIKI